MKGLRLVWVWDCSWKDGLAFKLCPQIWSWNSLVTFCCLEWTTFWVSSCLTMEDRNLSASIIAKQNTTEMLNLYFKKLHSKIALAMIFMELGRQKGKRGFRSFWFLMIMCSLRHNLEFPEKITTKSKFLFQFYWFLLFFPVGRIKIKYFILP